MPRRVQKSKSGGAKSQAPAAHVAQPQQNRLESKSGADTAVEATSVDDTTGNVNKDGRTTVPVPVVVLPQPDYLFEMLFLVFLIVYLFLQNYNIYFDNVDQYNLPFIAFTAVFFTQRVTWRFMETAWAGSNDSGLRRGLRVVFSVLPTLSMLKSGTELILQHDPATMIYLTYPYWLHISLFGSSSFKSMRKYTAEELNADPAAGIMLSFRQQLKHVIYGALEAGYFVAVLPIRFLIDRHAVFDHETSAIFALCGVVNAGVLLSTNLVSNCFADFQLQAKTIGCWREVRSSERRLQQWTVGTDRKRGDVVRHRKKVYIADAPGSGNLAEPDDWVAWAFYRMFRHPHVVITNIVLLEAFLIATQIILLCTVRKWQAVASWAVLIMSSYLVLLYSLQVRRKVIRATRSH